MPVYVEALVHKWRQIDPQALGDASHQPPGVEQMLGPEMTLRPTVAGFELNPEKVSYLAENTILNHAQ